MPGKPEISIANNDWAMEAAGFVHEAGRQAQQVHGRFSLALSGGKTPEQLYRALASPLQTNRFDWSQAIFFFSDERCVPPDHPDSNFGLANRAFFTPLAISPNHIHRMRGEEPDLESAALDYERQLRMIDPLRKEDSPQLDLVLLGLGQDGHTASLFPGTSALEEKQRLVAVGRAPSGVPKRLTLTLGVINRATVVLFLAIGEDKAEIVRRVLEPKTDADRQLPAALVKPYNGRLIWLLDGPAAALLAVNR